MVMLPDILLLTLSYGKHVATSTLYSWVFALLIRLKTLKFK